MSGETQGAHAWVIQIDSMTYEEAFALGKVLGSHGVTGRFLNGEVADQVREYVKLKRRLEGGE